MTDLERLNEIDVAMLRSMSSAIRGGMPFSFHPDDMADLLLRAAARIVATQPKR